MMLLMLLASEENMSPPLPLLLWNRA